MAATGPTAMPKAATAGPGTWWHSVLAWVGWTSEPGRHPQHDDLGPRGVEALEALAEASADVEDAARRVGEVDGRRHPELCLPLIEQLRVCQKAWTSALADLHKVVFEPAVPDRQYRLKFHPATLELAPYPAYILYAADVLHAGGMVEGSAALSDHLRPAATRLVRLVSRLRQNVTTQEETVPVTLQLMVLDRAWQDFEWAYLDAFATPAPAAMTEGLLAYTVQLSETLLHALQAGWVDPAEVDRVDPALLVALGRAGLFGALRVPPLASVLRALFDPALTEDSAFDRLHHAVAVLAPDDAAVIARAIFVPHAQAIPAAHHALFLLLCDVLDQFQRGPQRAGHLAALQTAFGIHSGQHGHGATPLLPDPEAGSPVRLRWSALDGSGPPTAAAAAAAAEPVPAVPLPAAPATAAAVPAAHGNMPSPAAAAPALPVPSAAAVAAVAAPAVRDYDPADAL